MIRRPPKSTLTAPLCPYTTRFRSEEPLLRALEPSERRSLGRGVHRLARHAVDDVRCHKDLVEVLVDDGPRVGIGVVDVDLVGRELMLEWVIFDAGETDRKSVV